MNFRALVTPVFAAVAASVAASVLLVIFAASEQDEMALQAETQVVHRELESYAERLSILASDNAWWDLAVQKIMIEEDKAWINTSIGATTRDLDHIDGALVVRGDQTVLYSNNTNKKRQKPFDTQAFLASALSSDLRQLTINDTPDKASTAGFVTINGEFFAYGASLVRANDEIIYEADQNPRRPIVIFYALLDAKEVAKFGTDNAISNVTFSPQEPLSDGKLAILDAAGDTLGWISWDPRKPGTYMARDMVLPSLFLLLIVVVAMVRFVKRADQVVFELEKANRAKSSFLASMSHEVRTPLNSILGFSEMMSLELFGKIEGDKNKEYLSLIRQSGEHLLSIINDILDISKLEADKFEIYAEPVQLSDIVDTCIHMVEPASQDRGVTVTHNTEYATIHSDERIIRQVIINILSNAIKFTKKGGAVHVVGEKISDGYRVMISDNGIGMSQDEVEIALSTFGQIQNEYTKEHSGTGLGLPLVLRFMTILGGKLDISSNPGKGTTVTLTFPERTNKKRQH